MKKIECEVNTPLYDISTHRLRRAARSLTLNHSNATTQSSIRKHYCHLTSAAKTCNLVLFEGDVVLGQARAYRDISDTRLTGQAHSLSYVCLRTLCSLKQKDMEEV